MDLRVSLENFTLDELECPCCTMFHMSDKFLISLQAFRYWLNAKYKKDMPIIVNSACRCKKHNSDPRVGGAKHSRHECESKEADAGDLRSRTLTPSRLGNDAIASNLFSTVIIYPKRGIIHVDTRPRGTNDCKWWVVNE